MHVDAFRVLGQIYMTREDYGQAEDYVLTALRIDPTNLWALVLMGNIYMHQGKLDVADVYYNKVLEYHPDDLIALNNIAGNYIQNNRLDEAIEIFRKLIVQDDTYLNCYYGLALCYYKQHQLEKAIEVCIDGMKKGINRPQDRNVREEIQKLVMSAAQEVIQHTDYSIELGMQQKKLSELSAFPLRIEKDDSLSVHARMEYHTSRHRDYDRIVYNPQKKYYEHLMMHEFMHLEMNDEASRASKNKIIVSGSEDKARFHRWIAPDMAKLKGKIPSDKIPQVEESLFNGLMLQATNSPLDLLVEDRIYRNYPAMRPLQMLSLVEMEMENLESTKQAAGTILPKRIVSANRIMNIVGAMHLQELYGFNIVPHYKPSPTEQKRANDLYEEYKAYREDYQPGEEYDLLEYFLQTLGLDDFMSPIDEMHFKELSLPEKEELPEECTDSDLHEQQNKAFEEQHKDGADPAETMMMAMYMVGAMEFLEGKSRDDVYRIALEIAIVGMKGIDPKKQGYSIQSIPGKQFGGYQFLAYYYVSWAMVLPEKVDSLGLPFHTAYQAAKEMFERKKKQ